ncbi:hypothetical protein IRJ41_017191, partial [Triplophysa rosa]
SFKPSKSRSMVLKRGKVVDKFRFSISGTKSNKELGDWLTKVDKSGLPGRFKAWLYQHSILARVLWPLLVYAVPMKTVESLERKISGFLRKWLGLPSSLTSAAMYGTSNVLQLPFSGFTEEFMLVRTREVLQYRDSRDCKVSSAGIEVKTGRKWKAGKVVEVAESRLRQKALVGTMATGRAGLANQSLWEADFHRVRFLVQAVYDALPSPANLHVWGKSETPSCLLCSGRSSLEHLLSSCPKALADGRYRWRHDQHQPVPFIKAGEKPWAPSDWQLQVNLGKQLRFPQHISTTSLRPDMIVTSEVSKQLIMLELTVPWEERIEEANERKRAKYQELVEECRERGWRTFYEPIEVGCIGFAGRSLCKVMYCGKTLTSIS